MDEPKNLARMLIAAQEQKNLINKLMFTKGQTDTTAPKSFRQYKHITEGQKVKSQKVE